MSDNMGGMDQLSKRRERRSRQAPQPRHPKLATNALSQPDIPDDTGAQHQAAVNPEGHDHPDPVINTPHEPADTAPPTTEPAAAPVTAPPEPTAPDGAGDGDQQPDAEAHGGGADQDADAHDDADQDQGDESAELPKLDIDLTDPTAHLVSPTVLSIPASIVKRFESARAGAPSHTSLVLDALRAHVKELPTLILKRRPGGREGDLFPFRGTPGRTSTDTPLPVRIRPTKGELAVMKKLTEWASTRIAEQRPGTREISRSEMVAAALDAFLDPEPAVRKRK
jgi:hypothetical protein